MGKILDKLFKRNKCEKVKKVTVGDLEKNAEKMQSLMDQFQSDIDTIVASMSSVDRSSEDGKAKYAALKEDLDNRNELIKVLQEQIDKQYANIKKMKDSRRFMSGESLVKVCVTTGMTILVIAAERENPHIMKMFELITKVLPIKA